VAPGHFDELNELLWKREAYAVHILDARASGVPMAKDLLKRRK